jgi:anaerobic selenocysteine-containing dehydrogenase
MSHNVLKMIKDGSAGRPDIYMTYKYTPVYANGEVQENIDVLKDESLIPYFVVCSPFYDESAALADLILPEPTYPERWDWEDMVSPVQIPEFYIRQAAVKPMGETRDFGDVVCELAERLGTPLGYKTKEEFVRLSCDMTPEIAAVGGFEFMKQHGVYHDAKAKPKYFSYMKELEPSAYEKETVVYDEKTGVYWDWHKAHAKSREAALEKGYTHTKKSYTGYVGQRIGDKVYSGFKPDKVNKSGYLEIYSGLMEDFGEAPLPSWKAIPEHEQMGADDMILTTFKVATQIHSRSQNCKYLTELYHNNPAWINPAEAAKRGIKDGDMIKVKSAIGEISIEAKVTPAVNLGVIAISHHCGHWEYGRYASGVTAPGGRDDDPDLSHLWWKGSHGTHPNWIIANAPDPVNGQMRWMDTVVQVTKL